jgi:hypothetical protein
VTDDPFLGPLELLSVRENPRVEFYLKKSTTEQSSTASKEHKPQEEVGKTEVPDTNSAETVDISPEPQGWLEVV